MSSIPPSARMRALLLDQMKKPGAVWSRAGIRCAAKAAGLSDDQLALAVGDGVTGLILSLSASADAEAEAVIIAADLQKMKVRERIAFAVRTRIGVMDGWRGSAYGSVMSAMAPWRVLSGPKALWASSDMIWRAIGDTSTDSNWYSKRAILSAVLAATLLVWLREDEEKAWERLDEAIEQVMTFETCKMRLRKLAVPNIFDILPSLCSAVLRRSNPAQ